MTIFAVIQDDLVVNNIIAESKEIAETLTGSLCVQIENVLVAEIGSSYLNNEFIGKRPYPSWTHDQVLNEWVAPVEKPDDENIYVWSEENLAWEAVTE
jgi:hypothetical protein